MPPQGAPVLRTGLDLPGTKLRLTSCYVCVLEDRQPTQVSEHADKQEKPRNTAWPKFLTVCNPKVRQLPSGRRRGRHSRP